MFCKIMCAFYIVAHVYAVKNNLIIDYFYYKKAPSVIGFSCNIIADDLALLRDFSRRGIAAAFSKFSYKSRISLLANATYWKLGIFFDIRCCDLETVSWIFHEASDYRMFDELRYWLILGPNLDNVTRVIDDRAFGLSTDFVIAVPKDVDNYVLYDVYNIWKNRGGVLNITLFGQWDRRGGMKVSLQQAKHLRRANLHRLVLRASFFKSAYRPPNLAFDEYLEDYAHATRDGNSKFGFHILSHLGELYNFSLLSRETERWEPTDPVGPLTRDLMTDDADFTGTPLVMTKPRSYLIKYVHQDWPFRTCFLFRNPQPTTIKVEEIFRPLKNEVWYLMIVLIVVSIVILAMVFRFEEFDSLSIRYSNSFLITIGALCQQASHIPMQYLSTRIAFFSVMLFSLVMYNYYSASVVSARLDEPVYKINDSLSEFGKMELKMSSEWMAYFIFFLKKPDWESQIFYHNYWLKLPEVERYMLPEVGMRLVQKGGFAYHTHPELGYQLIDELFDNREICELMEVHVARPTFTTFAVTRNSTFEEIARIGLTKISEVGLRYRQVLRWQYRKPRCRKSILSASSVNIYEFAPHLLLLMIGALLSIAVFVIEVLLDRRYGFCLIKSFHLFCKQVKVKKSTITANFRKRNLSN